MSVFTLMTEWFVFVVKGSKQFKGVFFEAMAASTLSASSMQSAYLYKYKDVRANRPHQWLLLLTSGEIAFIRQTRGRRMALGGRGRWEVFAYCSLMNLRDFACLGRGARRRQLSFGQVNSQSGFFRFECHPRFADDGRPRDLLFLGMVQWNATQVTCSWHESIADRLRAWQRDYVFQLFEDEVAPLLRANFPLDLSAGDVDSDDSWQLV